MCRLRINNSIEIYSVNVIVLVLSFFIFSIPYFDDLNKLFVDRLHGRIEAREDVLLVSIDDLSLSELGAWPWSRSIFAEVLHKLDEAEAKVVGIDVLFIEDRKGDKEFEEEIKKTSCPLILASKIVEGDLLESKFENENIYNGFTNFVTDKDGKIRTATLSSQSDLECQKSFALNIFEQYISEEIGTCKGESINWGGQSFSNQYNIIYSRGNFKEISLVDIYEGNFNEEDVKGKIILIGVTATDLKGPLLDNFTDVFGRTSPGVVLHANIINSLLQGKSQVDLSPLFTFLIVLFTASILFLISKILKRTIIDAISFISFFLMLNIFGILVFDLGINWHFIQISSVLIVSYIYLLAYNYFIEQKENRFIKKAFGQYINPELLGRLMKSPEELKLGGEKKTITVLFSDIRGFTTISERLSPEDLVRFTNEYLDEVSQIILENGGTIDKYIGDAVMAFWNAPLPDQNHKINAIETALKMSGFLESFNREHKEYPEIKVGIGINTGKMIVGNIGGHKRFDYTLLGDEVNLASRIEGLTKQYKVDILLAESSIRGIEDSNHMIFRFVDEVIVKGKSQSVRLYQALRPSSSNRKIKMVYERAFKFYQDGDFKKAQREFQKMGSDDLSKVMLERIKDTKFDKDWDGIWKWTQK